MRTDGLSEIAKVMISAIDDKINKYRELIDELEKEKQRYLHRPTDSSVGAENLLTQASRARKMALLAEAVNALSKKDRIVAGINRMQGKFDTEQLLACINNDGGVPISKENFAPTFSRL